MLFDSSNLTLKCCAGCPAVLKTYNGFRKHLNKCQQLQIQSSSSESCDSNNYSFLSIANDIDAELNELDGDNFVCSNEQDELNINNLICNTNQNLEKNISDYVLEMYSLGLPELTITKILENTSELILPLLENIVSLPDLEERQNFADRFKYSFQNRLTKYSRNKIFKGNIVQPIRVPHGIRLDKRYDQKDKCYKQIPITSTFTYIPLLDTLKVLLNNEFILKHFTNDIKINSDAYTHFFDGDVYKNNSFFHNNNNAIQLQIFFDEFEVCNPLGSKASVHKIGAFYFVINNLPFYINSTLENIHLLALCYNADIKQFGLNPVLEKIVNDIKILEKEGIFIESLNTSLKGTLVSLAFDNLGGNILFGMNESFNANYYCRICTIRKEDAQKVCTVDDNLLRTFESFIHLSNQLHYANSNTINFLGIKNKSPLFNLTYFKPCENLNIDAMHDFLEGICQRDLNLFFNFCDKNKIVTLHELNDKIQAFDFGLHNRSNLPSVINLNKKSNTVGQRAAQTLCLIIHLPIILRDVIPKLNQNFNKWKVVLLVITMLKIVLAPKITNNMLNELERTTKEHHELLMKEYSVSLIPKDHIIIHYVMIIKKMGPPRTLWTMRYESKHGYLKDLANKLKNFKDIAYTLSVRHQKNMMFLWKNKNSSAFDSEPILKNFKKIKLNLTEYGEIIMNNLQVSIESYIYVGKSVEFRGTNLILNKFVCSSFSDDLPNFSKILFIFSANFEIYAVCESWNTSKISFSCLGYIVKNTSILFVVKIVDIPYTKSWEIYESAEKDLVIITDYFL